MRTDEEILDFLEGRARVTTITLRILPDNNIRIGHIAENGQHHYSNTTKANYTLREYLELVMRVYESARQLEEQPGPARDVSDYIRRYRKQPDQ